MAIDRTLVNPAVLEGWPSASLDTLSSEERIRFRQSQHAVELFAKGERIAEIEKQTGISRCQLYHLIRRANAIHPDGRVFGFRAFLPYARIKPHERKAPVKRGPGSVGGGEAGAMAQLLASYPELHEFLCAAISQRPLLFACRPDGRLTVRGLRDIHRAFLDQCRKLGLREADYPLGRDQKGIRALSKHIKKLGAKTFRQAAKASGAPRDKGRWSDRGQNPLQAVARPYQAVEFDGHKLDIRLSITSPDPFGFEQTLELGRIWILVLVDIFTRAILGYHLVLAPEYDQHDVIRAVQKSLEPHLPMEFTLPGLGYGHSGGFPSRRLPELAYAVWDEFRFDNAKAHLAEYTLQRLREELGCIAHAGPPGDPDKRPIIERFFKTLAENMSHRLPATTLSSPEELRRLLNASNQQIALPIPLSELEELVEAVLASLNATPHESLGGRSPLQALEYWVRGQAVIIRRLPEPMRKDLCLLQAAHSSRVSGSVARGIRPHISFFAVRYSSRLLSERIDLIGKRVWVYYNPDDLRTLRVFEEEGGEIGILTAARPWAEAAHSLRMRRQITKLARDGKLQFDADTDPVQAYLRYLRQQAPRRRKAANALEVARRAASEHGQTAKTPPGPIYDPRPALADAEADAVEAPVEETAPAKPRRLNIPPGFSR
jgi:putative transposase